MDWNIHHDHAAEEALETLQMNLVCGGCGSASTLNIGAQHQTAGIYVQCMACRWDGYVYPTEEVGW